MNDDATTSKDSEDKGDVKVKDPEHVQNSPNKDATNPRKRQHEKSPENPVVPEKKEKSGKDDNDPFVMDVPHKVINGIKYLSPYWCPFKTRAKGRWVGRNMVECFSQEFLSVNPNYTAKHEERGYATTRVSRNE
ncbi:hypothetical protein WR25_24722 [Diploscapter pachys]|uniref:Uncharacterized protein n=1 Tax=Diploscapter pachys TaxID=2018661 RepID=A0A2A2L9A6_9BILA|nr:hypothetical protein WR25_24722 [Diploscapter pachys]